MSLMPEAPATSTPRLKLPEEMMKDPGLGALATCLNAVQADFLMLQQPHARELFLSHLVRHAEGLAYEARRLLGVVP